MSTFAFLGGVPQIILYDNTRLAVARILGDGRRQRTRAFSELQSHYLFEDRFGRPGKGNDKGRSALAFSENVTRLSLDSTDRRHLSPPLRPIDSEYETVACIGDESNSNQAESCSGGPG